MSQTDTVTQLYGCGMAPVVNQLGESMPNALAPEIVLGFEGNLILWPNRVMTTSFQSLSMSVLRWNGALKYFFPIDEETKSTTQYKHLSSPFFNSKFLNVVKCIKNEVIFLPSSLMKIDPRPIWEHYGSQV